MYNHSSFLVYLVRIRAFSEVVTDTTLAVCSIEKLSNSRVTVAADNQLSKLATLSCMRELQSGALRRGMSRDERVMYTYSDGRRHKKRVTSLKGYEEVSPGDACVATKQPDSKLSSNLPTCWLAVVVFLGPRCCAPSGVYHASDLIWAKTGCTTRLLFLSKKVNLFELSGVLTLPPCARNDPNRIGRFFLLRPFLKLSENCNKQRAISHPPEKKTNNMPPAKTFLMVKRFFFF